MVNFTQVTPIAPQHPAVLLPETAAFPRRTLKKGDRLYREGDAADTVFRIEEGLLKLSIDLVTGKERIVSVAGPGRLYRCPDPGARLSTGDG